VRRILGRLEDDYDLAILDCPPSISLVSESVFAAADLLLVPLVPSTLSVRTLEQLRDFLAGVTQSAPEVLAFFSMVDRRKRLHRELVASLPSELPGVADIAIPNASVVELMGVRRAPVVTTAPRHKASAAYAALWTQALAVLDGGGARDATPA
jgi:cellulose biosynthesis protein BcsQ